MTSPDNDKKSEPGWWYRGMTTRAQVIVVVGAGLVIVGFLVLTVILGIPLF